MTKKNNAADLAVFFIIGSLYSWSIVANLVSTTVLSVHAFDIFLIVIFFLTVFFVIFYNKITLSICISLLCMILIYLLYYAFFAEKLPEHLINLYEYFTNLIMFIRGYAPSGSDYTYPIVIFITLLITLYTMLFSLVTFNFFSLAGLGIVMFSISWITGYKSTVPIYLVFLFSFIIFFVKNLNMTDKKQSNGRFALTVMPVCFLLMVVSYLLPTPRNIAPINIYTLGQAIQKPYHFINDFVYEAFNPKYFSLQNSGFAGEEGRLGGRVNLNSRYVMSVYSDKRVYLAGAIMDTYTGYSWKNSDSEYVITETAAYGGEALEDFENEILFTDSGLIIYTEEPEFTELKYMPIRSVTVDIGPNRSGTVFRPINTLSLELDETYGIYTNLHDDIRTSRILRPYTNYTMQYLDAGYGEMEILKQSEKVEQEEFLNYMQLPEALPERVYTLTENITFGLTDDYSRIKKIEDFLNTYAYNLSPENLPLDADFVDYFLFESKEGYCTYYASAMVVMSRIIGMPARYVEGYITSDMRDDNGAYLVTNRQAHAWAEVYFNGFGWVAFEPTAPFYSGFYAGGPRPAADIGTIIYDEEEYDYYEEMGWAEFLNIPLVEKSEDNTAVTTDPATFLTRILIILVLGVIVLILIAFINSMRQEVYKFKLKRLQNGEKVCEYFKMILNIAGILGYAINDNETAQNYGKRIGKSFAFKNEKYFITDIIKIFSRAKYGHKDITDEELGFVSDAYEEMLKKAFISLKPYQYIFFRYVLYKF